ncbi:MAG TPA: sulfite exporter TauE/SafE family protein [Gemmatimonadota bacterium]|nr:sulfite exporter TauE/SafE family protein [Gemmatimonadota bacterium]
MSPDWAAHLALALAAAVGGALNVVAGGGSFLVLPVMIFLGLPPTVANGTNRIGILAQNATAVWGFHQHRLIQGGWIAVAVVPALAGAALGTWAAIEIEDADFRRALALIMVVVSLWTLWDPLARRRPGEEASPRGGFGRLGTVLLFFAIGVYGGFVQAGIGFLLLAATTLQGLDLVRGNALKVLIVLVFTPLTLILFALGGKIDWGMGLALAAGYGAGGLVGVRLTVRKGHEWLKRVVTVTVIVFAILLWFSP